MKYFGRAKVIAGISACAVAILGLVFGTVSSVSADSETGGTRDTVLQKAALYGVYRCYKENYIKTELPFGGYNGGNGILSSNGAGDLIKLPNGYTDVKDSDVSCEQLLNGYIGLGGQFSGVFSMAQQMGQTVPTDLPPSRSSESASISEFLEGMGYTATKGGGDGVCTRFIWRVTDGGNYLQDSWVRMCAPGTDSDGRIVSDKMEVSYGHGSSNDVDLIEFESRAGSITLDCAPRNFLSEGGCSKHEFDNNTYWKDFRNGILSDISAHLKHKEVTNELGKYVWEFMPDGTKDESYETSEATTFDIEDMAKSADIAIKYLSNGKYEGQAPLQLNEEERAILLQSYLEDYYKVRNYGCDLEGNELIYAQAQENIYQARIYSDGEFKMCYVQPTQHIEDAVYGYNSDYYFDGTPMSLEKVVSELNGMKLTKLSDPSSIGDISATSPPSVSDPVESPTSNNSECDDAAESLGWIVCPVLDRAGTAVVGMYEKVIKPFLEIKSEWLGQGDDSVYNGWKIFRDIANIVFVILFLVVIISQITGIGISNYNIKKFLPRFIMVVVLVNLSYIICQLVTDLSNILGSSLQGLFEGMANKISAPGNLSSSVALYGSGGTAPWFNLSAIASTLLTGVLGGAAVAGLVVTWEIWLPGFFLAVLGCLVGVLFFYIILGVRQAGVLILTALAPVAIVCYALPNTKTFFDRWKKMYVGVMVVYPICGVLIGGGQFASALMVKAGGGTNFFFDLVAMLIQVVPFFFIPSILKNSMAAMGNIGMKVAGFGNRVGGFAVRTAGNSRFMQEKKQEWLRNNNRRRDSRLAERLKKTADKKNSEVEKYEDRLKSLGVKDLTDDSAVRMALGERDYWSYRHAKNRAAIHSYRANRARRRYEAGVMEDATAEASAGRELLAPGTDRYQKFIAGLEREQRDKDDAGQVALYQEGKVEAFDGMGGIVNADNLNSLKKEHLALLEHVTDNPEDEAAASKLRAVQTLLGRIGPNGFDAIENNLGSLMANHAQFNAANSRGVGIASSHLSRNFAGQIKANSRSLDALLNDVNTGNFLKQSTFSLNSFTDAMGNPQIRFQSSYYETKGAQSIRSENVNDLGDAYRDGLLQATRSGKLHGDDLKQVLNVLGEAKAGAAEGKFSLKGEVDRWIDAVMDAAYSNGTVISGTRSEGSLVIGAASSAGIDSIVKQIESAGDWSTMSGAQQVQYNNLVNNIDDSLRNDAHTAENVRLLQNALATANAKHIQTTLGHGGPVISKVASIDLHAFKIPRGSKQKVAMPAGWTLIGGKWYDSTTKGWLNAEDAKKAQQIIEYNNSIDIENGM